MKHKVTLTYEIDSQDIDDIVCTALEGGINYWVLKVEVSKQPEVKWEYASEVISRGGELTIWESGEKDSFHVLTLEDLLVGLTRAASEGRVNLGEEDWTVNVDAEIADVIVQYALWDDIVYG